MTLTDINIFLIPRWSYDAIVRSKADTSKILHYDTLKDVLAIQDIADIIYLNGEFKLRDCYITQVAHYDSLLITKEVDKEHYDEVLKPLSRSDLTGKNIVSRLYGTNDTEISTYYKLVVSPDTVLVVLEEDVLRHLEEGKHALAFVKDILKAATSIVGVDRLPELAIYRLYLQLISNR